MKTLPTIASVGELGRLARRYAPGGWEPTGAPTLTATLLPGFPSSIRWTFTVVFATEERTARRKLNLSVVWEDGAEWDPIATLHSGVRQYLRDRGWTLTLDAFRDRYFRVNTEGDILGWT